MTTRSTRRHRWLRVTVGALIGVLVLVVAGVMLILFPSTDEPTTADAIVVLGEPDEGGMAELGRLIRQGVSDQVVISTPFGEPGDICQRPPTGITVTCFMPDPSTTRGEAREIGKLAAERGWNTVAVVTWPTHVFRSRVLIERCFHGDLQMVSYDDQMTVRDRIAEAFYQSGALLKAMAQPAC